MPKPANPLVKNALLTRIIFLKHKAEENDLKPIITVAKLIDMMSSSGLHITYQQLADLAKDPAIAPSIKSINKNQVEFNLGDEEAPAPAPEPEIPQEEVPEETGEEPQEEADNEEYNPEDFEIPEDEEAPQEDFNNAMGNQTPRQKPSIVSAMAKRAMARPD